MSINAPTVVVSRIIGIPTGDSRNLLEKGLITIESNGEIDPLKCAIAYIAKIRRDAQITKNNNAVNDARTRLLNLKSDKMEMELKVIRGELIPLAKVQKLLAQILGDFKTDLLGLPTKLASTTFGMPEIELIEATAYGLIESALDNLSEKALGIIDQELLDDNEDGED